MNIHDQFDELRDELGKARVRLAEAEQEQEEVAAHGLYWNKRATKAEARLAEAQKECLDETAKREAAERQRDALTDTYHEAEDRLAEAIKQLELVRRNHADRVGDWAAEIKRRKAAEARLAEAVELLDKLHRDLGTDFEYNGSPRCAEVEAFLARIRGDEDHEDEPADGSSVWRDEDYS